MAGPAVETMQVRVRSITFEAQGILSFDLRSTDGRDLPAFEPGAHIDLHLPNGLIRSYSLADDPGERRRYLIGVNRDEASRGGSRHLHEVIRPGDTLTISPPRNNFPLDETAPHSLFVAGGIGITPILSMIRRLESLGRDWRLYYCARTRKNAAFLAELRELAGDDPSRVVYNYDGERGGKLLDLSAVVSAAPADAHIYCCGPIPMLSAFEQATALLAPERVHVEYFSAKDAPALDGGFVVELARTQRSILVPAGKSILDALLDEGIQAPYSCMEGVCGSCETTVLEGIPEHRDVLLSKEEKASNKTMLICCSGCRGDKLVLDL